MKRFGRVLSWVLTLGLCAGVLLAWFNRQDIYDWWRLQGYDPPAAIVQLADDTTMTDAARHLFYVQHPELNDREAFSQNCGQVSEATIVLGCYIHGRGIFIFDVDDDPRLEGVEQVTAAHELLHAAYERLSHDERKRIDQLTLSTYDNLSNERIKQNVAAYRDRDPAIVANELHSILGTEVRHLPLELEAYYKRYFANRAKIVDYAERYEDELTKRRARAHLLEAQISSLKSDIDALEHSLQLEHEALDRERPFVTTQEQVDTFNARVDAYNNRVGDLNHLIEEHNNLVAEYEANALEQQELFNALSSKPTL